MIWEPPGGYADEGCIINKTCLDCPLIICIEDVRETGPARIGMAILMTEQAGMFVSPRLQSIRERSLAQGKTRGGREQQVERAITLYRQGHSQGQIAREVEMSHSWVGQALRGNGIHSQTGRPKKEGAL